MLLASLTGLRETELTLVTVGLFVSPVVELREFVVLPPENTRDGMERPILISHPTRNEAFEQYIAWLLSTGINTQPNKNHLGLDPTMPLLVTGKGLPIVMQSRGAGQSPAAMNRLLDKLIEQAVLSDDGVSRISLVRTAVVESYRAGMSTSDIMVITGFSAETIAMILAMDYTQYSPLADWFTERKTAKENRLEAFKNRRRFMV